MPEPSPIFYRFRSTDALLGERQELARQEIYFASKDELNDPLEGYANVIWKGDPILWRNLLRHYLLVLCEMVSHAAVMEDDFDDKHLRSSVFICEDDLPNAPIRKVYADSCRRFFDQTLPGAWLDGLCTRDAALSREELSAYLRFLHFHALSAVLEAYDAEGVSTPLGVLDLSAQFPGMAEQLAAWLRVYDEDEDKRAALHSLLERVYLEMSLIEDYVVPERQYKRGWLFLLRDFPPAYALSIEGILYPEWRTACFVTDPAHASMWGVYADGHKGVCLGFRSRPGHDNRPVLPLHGAFGRKDDGNGMEPWFVDRSLPFVPVRYDSAYPPTDFFRSLGILPRWSLERHWYSDSGGAFSPRVSDVLAESPEWREAYWARAGQIFTTKLPQWSHEKEHRLVSEGPRATPEEKKFRYNLADLEVVIFGIKTSTANKLDIIRTLAEAVLREGLPADTIRLGQAAFSRTTGNIEIHSLSYLNSQLAKLAASGASWNIKGKP